MSLVISRSVAWLNAQGINDISPLGEIAADVLGSAFAGIYHIDHKRLRAVDWSSKNWLTITVRDGGFATYDSNILTLLVFLAHTQNVRLEIKAVTHGYLQLVFCRVRRDGFFADRHPNMWQAIERFRELFPYALPDPEPNQEAQPCP